MNRNGHPDSATLALHAGGDLAWFEAWRTRRHVARCAECSDTVASYRGMCESLPELAEIPDLEWDRIAADMQANIRLGLAAGECVREEALAEPRVPLFAGARAAIALAGVVALLVTGLVLERPKPSEMSANIPMVQSTQYGVEARTGDQSFALVHGSTVQDVTYSVGAQGTMGASYVDPSTNLVTMTKVYVE